MEFYGSMDIFDKADEYGQSLVIGQLKKIFVDYDLTFDQHYDDKNGIDIYFTATSTTGKEYKYAAECKDRKLSHTYCDNWILEKKKYNDLMEAKEDGYKPLYINTYSDKWMNVWNLSKCTVTRGALPRKKTTVIDSGYKTSENYYVSSSDTVYSNEFI